jgi:hypothetical protein
MADPVQEAIRAIKAGDKAAGRRMLSEILKTDRDNETAWLWLAAVVEGDDQRRRCLKEVLRVNPNHPQATAALAKLQQTPTPTPPPLPPVDAEETAIPSWQQRLAQVKATQATQAAQPAFVPPPAIAPAPVIASNTLPDLAAPLEKPEQPSGKPRRNLAWYEVWLSVLINPSENSFLFILADPKLSLDRGIIWVFCATLIQYLVAFGLFMVVWLPLLQKVTASAGLTMDLAASIRNASLLLFVIGVPVLTSVYTLMFALQMGILHLIAKLFGGRGTYEHLVFASAAYQAPLLLISIVAVFIPYLNVCAGPLLGFYTVILMTNSLRAAYRLDIGRALGVIFLPGIVLAIFCCIAGYAMQGPIQQTLLETMMQVTPMP